MKNYFSLNLIKKVLKMNNVSYELRIFQNGTTFYVSSSHNLKRIVTYYLKNLDKYINIDRINIENIYIMKACSVYKDSIDLNNNEVIYFRHIIINNELYRDGELAQEVVFYIEKYFEEIDKKIM